jgi:hypothetical protein
MSTAAIIRGCMCGDTILSLTAFFEVATEQLAKADRDSSSMYSQRERELHLEFEQLIESRIRHICSQNGCTVDEFREALGKQTDDDAAQVFTQVLLLGSEFEVFVDVVRSREKREYFLHILRQWQRSWHSVP